MASSACLCTCKAIHLSSMLLLLFAFQWQYYGRAFVARLCREIYSNFSLPSSLPSDRSRVCVLCRSWSKWVQHCVYQPTKRESLSMIDETSDDCAKQTSHCSRRWRQSSNTTQQENACSSHTANVWSGASCVVHRSSLTASMHSYSSSSTKSPLLLEIFSQNFTKFVDLLVVILIFNALTSVFRHNCGVNGLLVMPRHELICMWRSSTVLWCQCHRQHPCHRFRHHYRQAYHHCSHWCHWPCRRRQRHILSMLHRLMSQVIDAKVHTYVIVYRMQVNLMYARAHIRTFHLHCMRSVLLNNVIIRSYALF